MGQASKHHSSSTIITSSILRQFVHFHTLLIKSSWVFSLLNKKPPQLSLRLGSSRPFSLIPTISSLRFYHRPFRKLKSLKEMEGSELSRRSPLAKGANTNM